MIEEFEAWWEESGQYGRSGGGSYEKSFAWNAWQAARSTPKQGEAAPVAWVTLCRGKVVNTYLARADAEFHAAQMQWGDVGVVLPISTEAPQAPEAQSGGGLQLGVSATEQGATICLMQPHRDGSVTVVHSRTYRLGDSTEWIRLAAAPSVEPAPADPSAKADRATLMAALQDNLPLSTNQRSALYELVAAPHQEPGWQPIETAPKNGKDVLVFTHDGLVRLAFFDAALGGIWSSWPGRNQYTPTHWMPLPAAPKEPKP